MEPAEGNNPTQPPSRPELDDIDRPRGFEDDAPLEIGIPVPLGAFGHILDPAKRNGRVEPQDLNGFREGAICSVWTDNGADDVEITDYH